jgi:adenylosuccinate lyase
VARTHGRHAGVITFGLKLAVWLSEIKRHKQRLRQVRERALVGKILGIVGTGAGLGRNALKIQEKALRGLGLKPAGLVTQVIQRDIHAEVVVYFALPKPWSLSIGRNRLEVQRCLQNETRNSANGHPA